MDDTEQWDGRVVIFAHPRTGSSNLCYMLLLHPKLKLAMEPFWHGYGALHPDERNYVDQITDIPSLEQALAELFARYNGMKILDYQLPEDVYDHLLLREDIRLIFLQRRNLLQAELSCHIADQTKVWGIEDMNEERRKIYENLAPVPVEAMASSLDYAVHLRDYYTRTVRRRPKETSLEVYYEDLYTDDLDANRASVRPVFDFLGLEMPEGDKMHYYLDPQRSKINSESTYRLLPNADELNAKFGSDDTGWLFR
ncbi:MAG: hypothetical protein HN341_07145 [Verrucomicrobia bacterium]|nr:hypothetical protein [Verrucomicrobiota bacterium]